MDVSIIRLVVLSVGMVAVLDLIGTIVLACLGREPPQVMGWLLAFCVSFIVAIPINPKDKHNGPNVHP